MGLRWAGDKKLPKQPGASSGLARWSLGLGLHSGQSEAVSGGILSPRRCEKVPAHSLHLTLKNISSTELQFFLQAPYPLSPGRCLHGYSRDGTSGLN